MKQIRIILNGLCYLVFLLIGSCAEKEVRVAAPQLFTTLGSNETGVRFVNELVESTESNYYVYMYNYIGGGVASADFNNDGLIDLFFISNTKSNKLYLNKGQLQFEDITESSGIIKRDGFDTGVAVADVNSDGYLDIYISRGGWNDKDYRFANMLYINNGDLTFTEKASELGLADDNRTVQSTFFDYDLDGDLDVFVSNTPDFEDKGSEIVDLMAAQSDPRTLELKGYDRLYNNDGTGHFKNVSTEAGILPDIGFGLNPQVGDLNNDGWLDIYVCNDFRIPDFAYINNGDGTFTERRNDLIKHMSFNSMGGDIADVNNDGLDDLVTLDMNPEDYIRSKTTMAMTPLDRFEKMVEQDYHYQYMHNMLQINNGNGSFSEIGNMSGIANTDWSWSVLLADFDLDGYNDAYVTNGVFRDVIDRDKNHEIFQLLRKNGRKATKEDFLQFSKMLPQQKLPNYFFRNKGDLTFENTSFTWADSVNTFSNGAIYADLDNDGDLEVVVNNINDEATILRNNASEQGKGKYIELMFSGSDNNPSGVGTQVTVNLLSRQKMVRRLVNSRGFLSSVSNRIHFGVAQNDSIVSIKIDWQDGKVQLINNVTPNQLLLVDYKDALPMEKMKEQSMDQLFAKKEFNFRHTDSAYNDYKKQILLPHKLSQTGPAVAKGDVNADGIEDLYIGGAYSFAGRILIGTKSGEYKKTEIPDLATDSIYEDTGAVFFDADSDGDQDLYVVSGSYEFTPNNFYLRDRLYFNEGQGNFAKKEDALPEIYEAGSVVRPADFDGDGDLDLFVAGRVVPGRYPHAPKSSLLKNNHGVFEDVSFTIAPDVEFIGMVTDAVWSDIDSDADLDLILTGEWMGIEVFENNNGEFIKSDNYKNLSKSVGWWNRILVQDIDGDGDIDIAAGNLGLNSKFHASQKEPFHVYTTDFDFNGTEDIFLAKYYKDKQVPVRGKTCSTQQLPHLADKIESYSEFASLDIEGIVGTGIKNALHYEATEFRSGIFVNNGNGNFEFQSFPNEVQQSPVTGMVYDDFDNDGVKDLVMAGNNYHAEVETTRSDGGKGSFLKGNKNGSFYYLSHQQSGFFANKDVRDLVIISNSNVRAVLVVNNNDAFELFNSNLPSP